MNFSFIVNASVERSEGKFATKDELEEQLVSALEDADPGSVEGDSGGQYEVISWEVEAGAGSASAGPKAPKPSPAYPVAPRISALIHAWIWLQEAPLSQEAMSNFDGVLDSFLTDFPRLTEQSRRAVEAKLSAAQTS